MKRAFIAIDLPEEVVADLDGLMRRLKKSVGGFRWTKPETLHLTLKFIGELDGEEFDRLAGFTRDGLCFAGGDPLATDGPIELYPDRVGAFPSLGRARVIWTGLAGEVQKLRQLASGVEERLEALGIERERRPFSPHLTLGRSRGRTRDLTRAVEELRGFTGGPWKAKSLVLYESELLPGGARHTPRAEYKFDRLR
jgi:2'-5' RNA ligase